MLERRFEILTYVFLSLRRQTTKYCKRVMKTVSNQYLSIFLFFIFYFFRIISVQDNKCNENDRIVQLKKIMNDKSGTITNSHLDVMCQHKQCKPTRLSKQNTNIIVIILVYAMAKVKSAVIVTLLCIIGATSGYDLMNKQNTTNLYMAY